ncbi:MAG: mandelate racemase/muconate lactonizing enzyme family protein [Deltaproteobacteria bacterium]|nr:mandelate racemase/muconate lactonizing enzyme family protein [Deltaproteobacteria bacterium]MBT6503633.1 mandelate racemase/muconate lactonizing enzyme family protein [Deltaproteobacteria bacterium]
MKITRIETRLYPHDLIPQLFVEITTDENLTGVGEAWWGLSVKPVESVINDALAPLIIGEDSGRIEYLWQKIFKYGYRYGTEGIFMCGLSGIDLALWDLLGKRLNVPVADLLGGTVRDSMKAYASLPPLRQKDLLVNEVHRAVEAGFAGVKLHEVEVELVKAAREVVSEDFPLMLDVNGHWTPLQAEENGKKLEAYGLTWLEEPIWPMQDHQAMIRLRQRVNLKLATGENEYSLKAFDGLMQSQAVDFIQPEITKIGGLSIARKISALSDLHNVAICPHSFRTGPAAYANVHWALSQMNMEWLEIPWLPEGFGFPSGIPALDMKGGKISLPKGVGLGTPII